jgi:protein-tyrosine phosphatase
VGRTGTILHAYFLGQGLSLAEAKARVKARRIHCTLLSQEQETFLAAFAKEQNLYLKISGKGKPYGP